MPATRRISCALVLGAFLVLMTTSIALAGDADADGVDDAVDNCPGTYNPGQEDLDGDAMGDVCDADTVVVTAVTLPSPRSFVNLRIVSGGVLTADAGVTVTGDMTIESGGTVTHSQRLLAGLVLDVAGTLDVQAGAAIDVDDKGLLGSPVEPQYGGSSEAFDPLTGAIVVGATGCSGATYGGPGASTNGETNPPYGLIENPQYMGSGGANCGHYGPAGNGGGGCTITAGTLILDGTVRADGGNSDAYGYAGGGSGGKVAIHAGAISGAGTVQANGGGTNGPYNNGGGGGGGGRIAIYYDTISLPTANLMAHGGDAGGAPAAGAGTIFLKDNAQANGDLIIDNLGVNSSLDITLRTALTSFRSLAIRNHVRLRVTGETPFLTIDQPVVLTANSTLTLDSGVTFSLPNASGFDLDVGSGTSFTLNAGAVLTVDSVRVRGTFNLNQDQTIPAGGDWVVDAGTFNVTGAAFAVASAYDFLLTDGGTVNLLNGVAFTIPAFDPTNVRSGTFNIGSGASLNVSANAITIGGGVTLVKDGEFGASDEIGSLTVRASGLVTHSERYVPGLTLNATSFIDVQPGGSIDVSTRGLRGGYTAGFGHCSEQFDLNDTIVLNCSPSSSGSYGGRGDDSYGPNTPYGYLESPAHLGSGGAGGFGGARGGHGGGKITLAAPDLTLNGWIRANGDSSFGGSGGSGGAIHVNVSGAISGGGGIEASARSMSGYDTGGGGGRIAIYYGFLDLPIANVRAFGGPATGGAGTIYLKDTAQPDGDVIIDNVGGSPARPAQTPLRTTLSTFRSVVVRNHGRLEIGSGLVPHLWVTDLTVDGSNSALVGSPRDIGGMRISAGGAITLSNGGHIESNGTGLLGGRTPGNSFGNAGEAYDSSGLTVVSGSEDGSGGSYGGLGGGPSPNPTYGDSDDPQHVGSGGSFDANQGAGGPGGGRIRIDADTCHIPAGTGISANGGAGVPCTLEEINGPGCYPGNLSGRMGGGSGGSLLLDCVHIDGAGSITANGGSGAGSDPHGGGGGRIVRHYTFDAFTGTEEAAGGGAAGAGQPGSDGTTARTLVAFAGMVVDAIYPSQGSNTGIFAVTVVGSEFDPAAQVRLVRSGVPDIVAQSVTVDPDRARLVATFNLSGRAVGLWDLVVTNPDGRRVVKAAVFEIVEGQQSFFARLSGPSAIRSLRNYVLTLEYGNDGEVEMPAPIVGVSVDSGVVMRLNTAERYDPGTIQILALGPAGSVDVLPPHSSFSIPVHFRTPDLPQHTTVQFTALWGPDEATLLDWAAAEQVVRPPNVRDDAWQAIRGNLQAQLGTTVASYREALARDAVYLAAHGSRTYSVNDLFDFELLKAGGGLNFSSLDWTADGSLHVTSGVPLVFTRTASADIAGRFRLGPLGRGWTHNFETSIIQKSPVEVLVDGPGASLRRFTNHTGTGWEGYPGETGKLAGTESAAWLLSEKDGEVSEFDPNGVLQSIEDANGNRITLSYSNGDLVQIDHSNGRSLSLDYNTDGRISRLTDSAGRQFDYLYDPGGEHLLSVTGPGGAETTYSYNPVNGSPSDHALTEISSPGGTHRYFTYDAGARLISQSGDGGAERLDYSYIDQGTIETLDAGGGISREFRGAHGETLESVDALGRSTRKIYDEHHRVTDATSAGGAVTLSAYDAAGNARQVIDPLGNVVSMGYTPDLSRLNWFRDENGNLTDNTRDAHGNLSAVSFEDGTTSAYTYDTAGRLLTRTNRRGQLIGYEWDSLGRLARKSLPGGRTISYAYDAHGNQISADDSQTGTVTRQYDERDLLTSIQYPDGKGFTLGYDAAGRRTQSVDQDGFTLNYAYDPAGRLDTVSGGAGTQIVKYEWDLTGRRTRDNHGNGTFTTYQYDAEGQVISLVNHAPGGAVQSSFDYTYDARGRRTSMTTPSGTSTYAYDDIDQLTEVTYPGGRTVTYAYDPAGNRISVMDAGAATNYTCDEMNRYTQAGTVLLDYDDDGNMTARTDASGTTTFEWDAENRLTRVVSPTGESWVYEYDALGNRIASTHDSVRTSYVNDPEGLVEVVAEYDSLGSLVARYVHGAGLVARVDANGALAYYGFDALGDTAQLTDGSGAVRNSYAYDAFGAPGTTVEVIPNPYRFVGAAGVATEGNGLEYMRARYYDPELGRFVSEDPIGIAGGLNLYRYAANRPTTVVDPGGTYNNSDYRCDSSNNECCFIKGPDVGYCWHCSGASECADIRTCILSSDIADPGSIPACERLICTLQACGCGSLPDCPTSGPMPWIGPPRSNHPSPIYTSNDPNEKRGPEGVNPGNLPSNPRFVSGSAPLEYTIYFENVSTASAPAQEVVVTDNLDPSFDFDSFALGEVAFGEYVAGGLSGLSSGNATVPLENSPYLVTVSVEHAPGSGLVRWTLRTIDPLTDDLPEDALAGFLPPNDASGRGEGHVSFTVRPKTNLSDTTQISNSASIVFDTNAPIATNAWVNTIDNGAPASTVTAVSTYAGALPNHHRVSWSGSDEPGGAGLRDYTIYLSEDAGPYNAWQSNTGATSADLTVECSHTYRFYSRARDFVGNIEELPGGGAELTYQAAADVDHDAVCDDRDNCPGVTNPTQDDENGNGVGDACEANPIFSVSSNPADNADFGSVQQAVDAAPSGTTFQILPGSGYFGTILVDSGKQFSFVGDPGQGEVVIDGASGPAFDIRATAGTAPIRFENLTITGQDGIRTTVPIEVSEVRFQEIPGTAVQTSGAAHLVNVIVRDSGSGARIDTGGSLQMEYATVAANSGRGVDNAGGGAVTIAASIVYGNGGGDLVGVPCSSVSFSDVAVPGCAGQDGNLSAPPALMADSHLSPASPCLDAGPDPATYAGWPLTDLAGNLRLRDFDGDGLARGDMGAFEAENTTLAPGEVTGLKWTDNTHLIWDSLPAGVEYHLYRGTLPGVSYASFGTCYDAADPLRTDTALLETASPPPGQGWSYLVTGEDGQGSEGTLGFAAGAERSNFGSCP